MIRNRDSVADWVSASVINGMGSNPILAEFPTGIVGVSVASSVGQTGPPPGKVKLFSSNTEINILGKLGI